jgi:hypothetical protein
MKFVFIILCFAFRLSFFEFLPKWHMHFNMRTKENKPFYIVCNMGFEDKTYGLNLLIVIWLQIMLQL